MSVIQNSGVIATPANLLKEEAIDKQHQFSSSPSNFPQFSDMKLHFLGLGP